ncbi:MAG: T9SS type A sorting domain-containing protein [Bacteroidota bacterium]
MNTKLLVICISWLLIPWSYAQNIVSGEYFFDTEPAVGNGTAFSLTAGTDVTQNLSIPTTSLTPGFHNLFVRVKNDLGVWGHYQGRMFYIIEPAALAQTDVVSGEYFFDTDPGTGNGTAISFAGGDDVNATLAIPAGLSPGFHNLFIRVKNDLGIWSHYQGRMFYLIDPQTQLTPNLVAGEYFFDSDPGVGNGLSFSLTASTQVQQNLDIDVSALSPGFHNVFVRVKNDLGIWSHYQGRMFYLMEEELITDKEIVSGEWFVDADPGIGSGTAFSVTPGTDVSSAINVSTMGLADGVHYLFIRVREDNGRWSHYAGRKFRVCADLLAAPLITGTANLCAHSDLVLNGGTVAGAESYYWTGPSGFLQAGNDLLRTDADVSMNGTYTFYALRSGGTSCDTSMATINVDVKPVFSSNNPQTICLGDAYAINGNSYVLDGAYIDTLTAVNGCDSIVTTQLTVIQPVFTINPQTICEGEAYSFNGNSYSVAATYHDTLQAIGGCDSIIVTQLTVNPVYTVNNPQAICDGESYTVGGNSYTIAGTYTDLLQTVNGCDSTVITQLSVSPVYAATNPQTICQGESYAINGNIYTAAGTYVDILQSAAGCDSTVTTELTVLPSFAGSNPQVICEGESYSINGNVYTVAGSYADVFQAVNGCDSIVTTQLTVNPVYSITNPQTICQGDSYVINGNSYSAAGTYTDVFQSIHGCDSTIITQLTVNSPVLNTAVTANGMTLTAAEASATYQWIDCANGNAELNGETSQSFTAGANGEYAVVLNSLTCGVSDTSDCVTIDNAGLQAESKDSAIRVYPNPADEELFIESLTGLQGEVLVFDAAGKLVHSVSLKGQLIKADVSKWGDGIYLIEIHANDEVIRHKFIKN